jgi:hypothetical protein
MMAQDCLLSTTGHPKAYLQHEPIARDTYLLSGKFNARPTLWLVKIAQNKNAIKLM